MTKETKIMTVREAIKEAMTHEMLEDENVFLMGDDVVYLVETSVLQLVC